MTMYQCLKLEVRAHCAYVWLDRPERHNAFDECLISELQQCLEWLAQDVNIRAVVIAGHGRSFCAGGDLGWMQRQAQAPREENLEDARRLAQMLFTLSSLPKPTLARVHGAALGGGLGMVAACDIAIASSDATFGATEVRLGLTPSVIAPYLLSALGERVARRYVQTGERFDAREALRIGLLHDVVELSHLDARIEQLLAAIRAGAPRAQAHAKQLLASLRGCSPLDPQVRERTAQSIAEIRACAEAREGIAAFFDKRKAPWVE